MRAVWLVLGLLACKDKAKEPPKPKQEANPFYWAKCGVAIYDAEKAPLAARPQMLLAACYPCGDWKPLLTWNVDGGGKREDIEALMVKCDAFCTGDSKLKFIGGVDKARGTAANTPWRELGKACGAKVGAHPDDRFMSAPYFALDRIGRIAGKDDPGLSAKLATVALPLPAITVTGAGVELPEIDRVKLTATVAGDSVHVSSPHAELPTTGMPHITLVADAIHIGTLPSAKLTSDGIQVDVGTPPYPGEQATDKQLADKLKTLAGDKPVLLLAPRGMPAAKLLPIITASKGVPLHLAVRAPESPEGWSLPAQHPVPLDAESVGVAKTVQDLATALVTK